nr:hypothetical protein [uncultured Flavobacterium sp.]
MKQILLFLAFIYSTLSLSQTVLTSYPIDLKTAKEECETLNAENTITHDVFVFIASASNFTILKYNSALFLNDQFVTTRQYVENRSMVGYSFSEDGNPTIYWFSPKDQNIIVIKYYLETKTTRALKFSLPIEEQSIISQYQKDNNFYLILKYKEKQALTVYVFKNGVADEKLLDFSSFTFRDRRTQQKTFNQILNENPIEKMDSGEYNPLYKAVSKSKLYTLPNRLILTLDQSPRKTQLFDINLENSEIKEKTFLQPLGHKNAKTSNSYYHENKLYQINLNSNELLFDIKDYTSGEVEKSFHITKNDSINFKNSPLLSQIENRKPKIIKKTSSFLKELASVDAGISVFKNKKNLFITLGGTGSNSRTFAANGFNMFDDSFGDFASPNYYNIESNYSVFFESVWTKKLETTTETHEALAADKIYYFIDTHKEIFIPNILKLNNYSVLGYYDTAAKEYVLRKFTDGI